ncbi:hypothetical protein QZM19_19190 [Burkholderia multivorans]|nr:hypothetical protein [Burkholderia multivorans]
MNQEKSGTHKPRGRRPAASLEERIAEAERLVASLKEQKKLEERQNLERNRKAILDLFKSEGVDTIPIEKWKAAMPKLKTVLGVGRGATDVGSGVSEAKGAEQAA